MDDQEKRHLQAENLGNFIGTLQLHHQRKTRESLEGQLKLLEEQQQAASREKAREQLLPKCCYCNGA